MKGKCRQAMPMKRLERCKGLKLSELLPGSSPGVA
jgi:hypothetical protein